MTNTRPLVPALLLLGLAAGPAPAQPLYHFTALPKLPGGKFNNPMAVNAQGTVGGVGDAADGSFHAYSYSSGVLTDYGPGTAFAVNVAGVAVGDAVIGGADQAARFGAAAAQPLGRLPGETFSQATAVNAAGVAVGVSQGANNTFALYRGGSAAPINLGAGLTPGFGYMVVPRINDAGQVAGVVTTANGDRAFRYDTQTAVTTLLNPLSGDPDSWGLGITAQGDVLGYSFTFGGKENIGFWGADGQFRTYFTEGTTAVPTVSNVLVANSLHQIVISATNDGKNYLVDAPGSRRDLASLVADLPPGFQFDTATGINDRGWIVGFGADQTGYLLTPVPEPGSLALLAAAAGLAVAGRLRRPRRSRTRPVVDRLA